MFVFGLPNLLALAAYVTIFWRLVAMRPLRVRTKVALVVLLTIAAGFLSMWGSLLVPFNTYGT
jgi:hypothetical protein